MTAACGALSGALPVAIRWADSRVSSDELVKVTEQIAGVAARTATLEQGSYQVHVAHVAAVRELAAAWASERVRVPRGGDVAELRAEAAKRARQHFDRLMLAERNPDEEASEPRAAYALRVAIQQVEAGR